MSVDSTVVEIAWRKNENIRNFQATLWLSSVIDVYRRESGRCRTLPFFLTFLNYFEVILRTNYVAYVWMCFRSLGDGLDDPILKNWRDITVLQKHWIGDCNGTRFEFELEDNSSRTLSVFTHNPEHVTSASFIAVPRDSLLDQIYQEPDTSDKFRKLPVRAINPFTGEFLPIYVTSEIEYPVGADSHLGIPEISEIDRHFATLANIPLIPSPAEDGKGMSSAEDVSVLRERINQIAQQRGLGGYPCSSKLRDWLISRQRYWGTPIPMVHCENCGPQPVPYNELPVVLPVVEKLSSHGKSPLLEATDWLNTKCPK